MAFNFGKLDYWGEAIPYRPTELAYVKQVRLNPQNSSHELDRIMLKLILDSVQVPLPLDNKPKSAKVRTRCIEGVTILEHTIPSRDDVSQVPDSCLLLVFSSV